MDLFSREKGLFLALFVSGLLLLLDIFIWHGEKMVFIGCLFGEYLFPKNLNVKRGYVFLVSTFYYLQICRCHKNGWINIFENSCVSASYVLPMEFSENSTTQGNFCNSVSYRIFFCMHYRNIAYRKIYWPLIPYTLPKYSIYENITIIYRPLNSYML